jgi:hypothetical protein
MAEVMKDELSIVVMRHRAVSAVSCLTTNAILSAAFQEAPAPSHNCWRAPLNLFELISLKEVDITCLFFTFQE